MKSISVQPRVRLQTSWPLLVPSSFVLPSMVVKAPPLGETTIPTWLQSLELFCFAQTNRPPGFTRVQFFVFDPSMKRSLFLAE